MRFFTPLAFLAFAMSITAVPITPSAPSLQRRAEQFRLQGLQEHEIAEKLTLVSTPSAEDDSPLPTSLFSSLSTKLHSLLRPCSEEDHDDYDDISGDIAPGSLEAPQMLPRPVATLGKPSALGRIIAVLRKGDEGGNFAYEGKELELRRPTGMRHWGAADKWRLF
ncbi:hypothetical protein DPSP01_008645 [Paraphaeosphaeria sporulosa]|uniref:Uncharacterized protein n=1 Tax=Paraphaeosphaeria sporulosa TaxID=1460663 RepID=A0A177BY11_9PLEO|nr:uncharacterized protein CC84DRAFT_1222979 [Paraphaeosphaeria sporulosa]OAF99286.1 hypothetical protein CC84DRAFT_1222979 [Paraphaeosphaeria sporulosa]